MLSSNYTNSVETELRRMIRNLSFQENFNSSNLSGEIDFFLDINTRPLRITETTNQYKARQKLLNKLEYYKDKDNKSILIKKFKYCKRLEQFKTIIQHTLEHDLVFGRGKKTKRKIIRKSRKPRKPRKPIKSRKPRKKKN